MASGRPLVVGTLHDRKGIAVVKNPGIRLARELDLLEIRLDALHGMPLPESWALPVIATARHPLEGGCGRLSLATRHRLLEGALDWASALDVELRSSGELAPLVASAHQRGRTVILSHHDFEETPTVASLRRLARKASGEGADLFKVATFLRGQGDLLRLLEFQCESTDVPVTTMGMGPAGRFSRIVLGGFGAPLCYGWLGSPQVPGQWPARDLKALLSEVLPA